MKASAMIVLLEPVALAHIERGEEEHAQAKGKKDDVGHMRVSSWLAGRSLLRHQISMVNRFNAHKEEIKVYPDGDCFPLSPPWERATRAEGPRRVRGHVVRRTPASFFHPLTRCLAALVTALSH